MSEVDRLLRRTKIIATLGPATDDRGVLARAIDAGINVVRLNFSHSTHEEHRERINMVRSIAQEQKRVVGILADLQGPKIRIAAFKEKQIELVDGATFILDAGLPSNAGIQERVGVDYKELPNDVYADDILLLDDGRIELQVTAVNGSEVVCRVLQGGVLSNHKGINRKGGGLSARALTDKDKLDLAFALTMEVDYIAISFPRNADDVKEAKQLIEQYHGDCAVIAKIERTEAVAEIDEIIEASDGVMVARGDLAVEIGDAEVPVVQKKVIKQARNLNKPVIIATQMMESMITSSVPTRAEVSDVATAVIDNVDAVMLSAETAVGKYPVSVVRSMSRVCLVVERQPEYQQSSHRVDRRFHRVDEMIAMATMYTANHFDVKAIVSLTESGATTRYMSRIRTAIPIFGLSRFKRALGKMTLYRGVYPLEFDVTQCTRSEVNQKAIFYMEQLGVVASGDVLIFTKGDYLGVTGGSNAMKIVVVGNVV